MGKMSELAMAIEELRKAAATINDVADTLTELFSGTAEAETTDKPDAPTLPPQKLLTLEEVRAVLAEKSRNGHTAEIRVLLQKYGATKLSEIDSANYQALLADAEGLDDAT